MVEDTLNRRSGDLMRLLGFYMKREFYSISHRHDDIVAGVMAKAWENRANIQEGFDRVRGEWRGSVFDYLYGALRKGVRWGALNAYNSDKRSRRADLVLDGGEDENGVYVRPSAVVKPEQEDVVFYKQMIERCYRLPAEERALMMLVFDRATALEMAEELGMTPKQISHRVQSIAVGLMAEQKA
jgi:DNA-directed RNA polymerase specialized sigma24 family protein